MSARHLLPLLLAALLVGSCTDSTEPPEGATPSTGRPAPTTTEALPPGCPDGIEPVETGGAPQAPPTLAGDFDPRIEVAGRGALDIGVLLPVTGPLAHLAPPQLAALELAVADVNAAGGVLGAPVTLSAVDAGGPGDETAAPAARRLLDAGVDVIVGAPSEGMTLEVIDEVTGAGVVLFSAHNNAPAFTDYEDRGRYFRTSASDVLQGRTLADLVAAGGARHVAVIARDDGYGRPIAAAFEAEADRAGLGVTSFGYEPADLAAEGAAGDLVSSVLDAGPDAVAVIGLLESSAIIDALADAGSPPRALPTYGVGGNMGDRLGELVDDPHVLACMRGVVPAAPTPPEFRRRLLAHDPALVDLAYAAESYDAVVIAALAAELAGSDAPAAVAAAIPAVTRDGVPCHGPPRCLELLRDPEVRGAGDIDLDGRGGRYEFGLAGEPTVARFRVVQFDAEGRTAQVSARRAPPS